MDGSSVATGTMSAVSAREYIIHFFRGKAYWVAECRVKFVLNISQFFTALSVDLVTLWLELKVLGAWDLCDGVLHRLCVEVSSNPRGLYSVV